MKLALFLHGWGGTKRTWFMPLHSLPGLLEDRGYQTLVPSLPGRFIDPDKDLSWYADYIDGLIKEANQKTPFDEINIICYSMGGVLARHYLKSDIGTPELKNKVTRVITIASPHHGTDAEMIDLAAELSQKASDMNPLSKNSGLVNDLVQEIAQAPCYLQVKPDSDFLQELNTPTECVPGIEWHSIRTRGDKVVTPPITAVLSGAQNYFIDNRIIGHVIVRWMPIVHEIIEQILDGTAKPSGLQAFPAPEGCSKQKYHHWLPLKHWDKKTPEKDPRFLFECLYCGQTTWHRD